MDIDAEFVSHQHRQWNFNQTPKGDVVKSQYKLESFA
jgi:hypothetical protein